MEKHPVLPIGFCLLGVGLGLLFVSGVPPDLLIHSKSTRLITLASSPLIRGLGWFLTTSYVAMLVFMGIKIARGTWKSFCARLTSRFTAE